MTSSVDISTCDIMDATAVDHGEFSVATSLKMWKGVTAALWRHMSNGQPVRLERFGAVGFDSSRAPVFANHRDFVQAAALDQTAPMDSRLAAAAKLSLTAVASELSVARHDIERFLSQLFTTLARLVQEARGKTVRLGCSPMGDWVVCKNVASFQFHDHGNQAPYAAKADQSQCGSVASKASALSSRRALNGGAAKWASARPTSSRTDQSNQSKQSSVRPLTANTLKLHNRPATSKSTKSSHSPPVTHAPHDRGAASNNHKDVLDNVKKAILARGGIHGIQGISRIMRIMDDSGDKRLSRDEFRLGLRDYGVDCSDADLDSLMQSFDVDGDGFISFDEFLVALRGDISSSRMKFIEMAFNKLDKTGDGQVTIDDLRSVYNVSKHPDFVQGKKNADQVLTEFLSQWDSIDRDGVVQYDEFVNYYRNVSASIDTDNYFELMMRNAWHLSGGVGQCANSSIKRVLVTHPDGRQTVEEAPQEKPVLEVCRDADFVKYCSILLFSPPCSVDVFAQKLGANRVLGNGQERVHVKVLAKVLCQLDKALNPRQAHAIAKSFDSAGTQLIHIPSLHQTLADRFGKRREPPKTILDKLRSKLFAKGDAIGGILGLQRTLPTWDSSGDGLLSKDELKKGLDECGVDLNLQEVDHIMTLLDVAKCGAIRIDDLLAALRGRLSPPRLALVRQAFSTLEATCGGRVTLADLKQHYNAARQRGVVQGKISERQALVDFLAPWDTSKNGPVTLRDFEGYYENVSASVEGDDQFDQVLRDSWNLQPTTAASTSRPRTANPAQNPRRAASRVGTPPRPTRDDKSASCQTQADREAALMKLKAMREKAALIVQTKFRGHKAMTMVDCVKRKQAAEAVRRQEVMAEATRLKPRVTRPALNSYHGF